MSRKEEEGDEEEEEEMGKGEVPPEQKKQAANRKIWDCGSTLYDSFELKALEKQLYSAISSRSLSMPHLSDHRPPPPTFNRKPASKISRSFNRLIRAVFRSSSNGDKNGVGDRGFGNKFLDRAGEVLSTIPEGPELSPEMRSLVMKTASERFTETATASASVGIFCK